MWFERTIGVILVFGVLNSASGQPFLYSAPSALLANLASSASASASSGTNNGHIADLRRKEEKSEKLQVEKRLIEDDNFNTEDQGADTNEVQPSLIQKKINKIFTKIRFLSTLSSIAGNNNRMEADLEDFKFDDQTTPSPADPQTFQKIIHPHEGYGAPLKLNLKIGREVNDTDEENVTDANDDTGAVTDENFDDEKVEVMHRFGQIGVFFAELIGSLVGLAYGATAHINNALQGFQETTEPTGL